MTKTQTDVQPAVRRIRAIGDAAREVFIDREELISAIELAMVSGQHAIVFGPPGTGKSRCLRYFADAMGAGFFRKLLNPDLPREELVGPYDPKALQDGKWERVWTGLATNPVCFIDEIGKGSSPVRNMLLDSMEERLVSCGGKDYPIPLHTLVAASNETIKEETPAIWNRFSIRVIVSRITSTPNFVDLLECAWSAESPVSHPVSEEELKALRQRCREMAARAYKSKAVTRVMVELFTDFDDHGSTPPSERQWLNVLVLAAAHALLNERDEITDSDLVVAGFAIWDEPHEKDDIQRWVKDVVTKHQQELVTATELLGRFATAVEEARDLEQQATVSFRIGTFIEELEGRVAANPGVVEWEGLLQAARTLHSTISDNAMDASRNSNVSW